jgi:PleD family two-component response regulator
MHNVDLLKTNNVEVDKALELWGDMDSYDESLKEFKESLSSKLANLESYKNQNDLENYSILAHSIKSELKYLGFMKDSEIFLNHELESKARNYDYVINNFGDLRKTTFKIEDLIKKYFNEDDIKKDILIVDDSNIILNFLEKYLNENFKILKANSGEEALTILSSNNIYALFLDLNMPGISGFDVLKYLKENKSIEKIPVVIITGDNTEDTIKQAFAYSIIDVLNKPFNENNIERVLESIREFYESKK